MPTPSLTTGQKSDLLTRSLRVNEIFLSLQGETTLAGLPTAFIRLTGCPLRCRYCDTAYAFHEGSKIRIDEILRTISGYRTRYVTVTGGEPLAQNNCLLLLSQLCDEGYSVSLETSGAIDIEPVDNRVIKIIDIKTPGSGEEEKNRFANLQHITTQDQVKFVICDRADYDWSKARIKALQLIDRCEVLFSPSHQQLDPSQLADWILADKLAVRLQIQLHKYLWGDVRGR